jgi:hypothetical protein
MKDLRHPPTSSTIEERSDKSKASTSSNRKVDAATIKNNPKVDAQLVSDFYRLVDASKGVIRGARGANYRLSHPLGSNDVPTDAIPIGRRRDIIKKPKHR